MDLWAWVDIAAPRPSPATRAARSPPLQPALKCLPEPALSEWPKTAVQAPRNLLVVSGDAHDGGETRRIEKMLEERPDMVEARTMLALKDG
jgi:hypothetical protein